MQVTVFRIEDFSWIVTARFFFLVIVGMAVPSLSIWVAAGFMVDGVGCRIDTFNWAGRELCVNQHRFMN